MDVSKFKSPRKSKEKAKLKKCILFQRTNLESDIDITQGIGTN